MQQSLSKASVKLPTFGADLALHIRRLAAASQITPIIRLLRMPPRPPLLTSVLSLVNSTLQSGTYSLYPISLKGVAGRLGNYSAAQLLRRAVPMAICPEAVAECSLPRHLRALAADLGHPPTQKVGCNHREWVSQRSPQEVPDGNKSGSFVESEDFDRAAEMMQSPAITRRLASTVMTQ
jgi:hypothetical protein